ncbi:MAG: ABC transporter permease [Vulcanimicrobiota bacterium]
MKITKRWAPWLLLAPFLLWNVCFVLGPLLTVVLQSLHPMSDEYEILSSWTLSNYQRALSVDYLPTLLRSVLYAGLTTVLCLLLGYPLAYTIALYGGKRRSTLLILIMLPFWTSYLVRTYAWMTLLQTEGLLNSLLLSLGLVTEPIQMLNTPGAVVLGLTYALLPFATLPIYVALEHLDRSLLDAAVDLGASSFKTFWTVILPLSLPGVVAGSLLTFVPAMGDFVTPDLLGGPDTQMIGNLIQQQYLGLFDWPFGSALSLVLIVLMAVGVMAYNTLGELDA